MNAAHTFASRSGIIAALALALLPLRIAEAQQAAVDNTVAARALFQQGLEMLEAGQWEDAADRFDRALVLRPSPQITYNLTTALIELGQLVRAVELLRQVTVDPAANTEVREAAEGRRAELQPRLASLTLEVDDELGEVELYLNELLLQNALIGVPFPMDPGAHEITARQDGEVVATLYVSLDDGEERTMWLETPVDDEAGGGATREDSEPSEQRGSHERTSVARRWWFWTIVGVVVVGAGLGLGLGLGLQERQGEPVDGLGGTLILGDDE